MISVVIWSMTAIAAGILFLRLIIRHVQTKLWLDDLVLGISWSLLLAQVIVLQVTINMGFGKHALDIDFSHFDDIAYYGATGLSVSIFAISLSKISFAITLLRLTDGWYRKYTYFAMANLAIFAIPVAIIPWVQCRPLTKTFVDIIPGTCINKYPSVQFGRFQAIWSAILDVSLALLPWKILWGLKMRFAEKIGVCIAMSMGILAGAAAIIRGHYIELLTTQDLSYDAYNSVIWSAAETALTIFATSMPVLRVFFKQAVNSAIETIRNPSSRNKSRDAPLNTQSTGMKSSLPQSSSRTNGTIDTIIRDSEEAPLARVSKDCLEMGEIVVDEKTGRVTSRACKDRS